MYQFVTGPLAWISFAIFFIGLIARIIWYVRGLDWKLDRIPYGQYPGCDSRGYYGTPGGYYGSPGGYYGYPRGYPYYYGR